MASKQATSQSLRPGVAFCVIYSLIFYRAKIFCTTENVSLGARFMMMKNLTAVKKKTKFQLLIDMTI